MALNVPKRVSRRRQFFRPRVEQLEVRRLLATVTVNTTSDVSDGTTTSIAALLAAPGADGFISLREAILAANNTANVDGPDAGSDPDPDAINFNIAGSGVKTIAPSFLPELTDAVIVDGYTQPGSSVNTNGPSLGTNAVLLIEVNFATASGVGLRISADNCKVRGLVINRTSGSGVIVGTSFGKGAGSVVEGNFIGTNPAGSAAGPANDGGVLVQANDVLIGGTTPAARNLISGNGQGIGIVSVATNTNPTNVRVQGNLIGTNAAGTAGINVSTTTASGTNGVSIAAFGGNEIIGGATPAARNIISGFDHGIVISQTITGQGGNNKIQGNYIGLDVTGSAAIPNRIGVQIGFGVANAFIGGTVPGEGNVISGNREANISLDSTNTVQGNLIGPNATGTGAPTGLPSGPGTFTRGIDVDSSSAGNSLIGGAAAGAGNVIAFNVAYGVFLNDIHIENVSILGNSIYSNGQIGINLLGKDGPGGVNFNNSGPFNVANRGQNFPVITGTSGNVISATLSAEAAKTYRVELFASNAADPSGFGEGQIFLGFVNVTTDAAGNTGAFTFTSPTSLAGQFISATATDPVGNTSEFSGSVAQAQAIAPTVTINQAAGQADPTSSGPIQFAVIFSTSVTGFTGSDVSFAGSTVGGALVAGVSGSGADYTVSVTGMTGGGTVVASIPAGAAVDASTTSNTASTSTDNTVTFTVADVAPTVTINQAVGQTDPASTGPIQFTVVFGTPVTGFSGSDVSFAGSTVGGTLVAGVSGSGASYTVSATGMTGSGTVIASIPAAAAVSANNTANMASTSTDNSVTFAALVAPTVTINQAAGQADPTSASPIQFTVVFGKSVTGFAGSDVSFAGSTVGGTLLASVSGSGANYTVSVTGVTSAGTVVASIAAGAATDSTGMGNAASTSTDNSVTATFTAPQASTLTITLVGRQASYKNEFGLFIVDDAAGRIGALLPGDAGYARAAIARTKAVFAATDKIGMRRTVNLPAGSFYGMYLIQNSNRSRFLAINPKNLLGRGPQMFFTFLAANPDHYDHLQRPSSSRFAFEDQTNGGDKDFNDLVVDVAAQAPVVATPTATALTKRGVTLAKRK